MPVRNNNWYNLQSTRRYPLDDRSTGTGDDGTRLLDDILVDCQLRWPHIAGEYAYVGGITVTNKIVTVMLLAASAPDATDGFVPLGVVSLPQPVVPYVHYPISALYPGTGGFLVFGDVTEAFSARFSTPQQGLLAPRCAQAYHALPIPTLRKWSRNIGLAGLVKILGGPDVEVVKETMTIDGHEQEVLVVRLISPTTIRNVLENYIGPCDLRPESRNCAKEGVETINSVAPDCNGNINIVFRHLTTAPFQGCNTTVAGVTLDQSLGLTAVCTPLVPGRFVGVDLCALSESSVSSSQGSQSSSSQSSSSSSQQSSSSQPCLSLPYLETFDGGDAEDFVVKIGQFDFVAVDSPEEPDGSEQSLGSGSASPVDVSYRAIDASRRNVSVVDACGLGVATGKRVTTHVSLANTSGRHNGGSILNYHIVQPLTNAHIEYFSAVLDRDAGKVRLLRFNGTGLNEESSAAVGSPILFDDWYQIVAEVTLSGSGVAIRVTVTGITNPAWPMVQFTVTSNRYLPADGLFGLGTDRSQARFSFFLLEDI